MIGRDAHQRAFAREDYCARELDVDVGQVLDGDRIMNGWVWSEAADGRGSGWVPLRVLREGP
ncbi:hypothetical protein ACLB90_01720 [Stenotrophomonas sp. LGBM10]|uniref:hypothetical protein n=1 Tax=Stenotrophomonas sp. LGBM10 TaxID=3390038 RepID=UPI00398AC6E6